MSEQCPLYPQSGHSAGRSLAVSALTPYTNTQLIIRTISQPKIISMGRSLRFRPGNQRYISDCCVSSKGQPQWYTDCGDVRFQGGCTRNTFCRRDHAVPEREDPPLPIRRRRDGRKLPPDGSNGSDGEALLDQGGGREAVAK